jgi:hypothetical protein
MLLPDDTDCCCCLDSFRAADDDDDDEEDDIESDNVELLGDFNPPSTFRTITDMRFRSEENGRMWRTS